MHGTLTHRIKMVDIELAAENAPDPSFAEEHDPRTRSMSEGEQDDLVEAAYHGFPVMEDILEDNNSFDEHRQFQELEDLKGRWTPS